MNIQIAIRLAVAYKEAMLRKQSRKTAADMPVRAKSPNYNPHPVNLDNKYKKDWDDTMKVVNQRHDRQTDRLNKIRDDYIWNTNQGFGYNLGGYGQAAGDVVTGAESLAAGLGTGLLATGASAGTGPASPFIGVGTGTAAAGATGAALGPINRTVGNYYLGGIGKKIDSALGWKTDEEKTNEQLANAGSYTPGGMALDAAVNAVPAAAVTRSAVKATIPQRLPKSLGAVLSSPANYYAPKNHIVDPSGRIPVSSYKYRTGRDIDLDGNAYGTAAIKGKPGEYIKDRNAKHQQTVLKNMTQQQMDENPKAGVQKLLSDTGFKFPQTEGGVTYFGNDYRYGQAMQLSGVNGNTLDEAGFSGIKRLPIEEPKVTEVKVLSPSEAADKALGGERLVNGERHPKIFADGAAPADTGLTREKIVAWLKEQARVSTGKEKITKRDLFAEYTKPENKPAKDILDGYKHRQRPTIRKAKEDPGEFTIPVNGEPRQSYLYDGFYDSNSNEYGWLYPYLGAERALKLERLAGSVGAEAASNLSGKVIESSDTDKR